MSGDEQQQPAPRYRGAACFATAMLLLLPLPMLVKQLRRQPSPPRRAAAGPPQRRPERYTVVLNAFRRDVCVEALAEQMLRCPRAGRVKIVWNDAARRPPDRIRALVRRHGGRVHVAEYPDGNITNRFDSRRLWTEAVLSVDDDEAYSCRVIEAAFTEWLRRPSAMVCFAPRLLLLKGTSSLVRKGTASGYSYNAPYEPGWDNQYGGYYNTCFVTKGGFLHRRFYREYWKGRWREVREMVNRSTTAEDILMGVVHSHAAGGAAEVVSVNVPSEDYFMLRCDSSDQWWKNSLSVRTAKRRQVIMDTVGARFRKSVLQRHYWTLANSTTPGWVLRRRRWLPCNKDGRWVKDVRPESGRNVTAVLEAMRENPRRYGQHLCMI
eukprot:TRINITY_DN11127_c0_g1_i1.p1 TRINITY_DN11127_c0_g1~~TRINITY_DN11127_c0_g1_i1.p1  ORF type:complete len:379 (+),score=141.03 TRINITY_DN11127_c0_g1_i1:55-1191(+)